MTNSKLDEIKAKVRTLLMKAADGAATEAEAAGAMAAARKLMERYQVAESDLAGLGEDDYKLGEISGQYHAKSRSWYLHPIDRYCAAVVGRFCAVIPYTSRMDDGTLSLKLFGMESDVELAAWMLSAFKAQFENDWDVYKRSELGRRLVTIKDARLAFAQGFTQAVNKRLGDWMFRGEANSPAEGTGDTANALVVKKTALVEAELARRGVILGRGSHRGARSNHAGANAAGFASGSRAETGRGVGGGRIAIGAR